MQIEERDIIELVALVTGGFIGLMGAVTATAYAIGEAKSREERAYIRRFSLGMSMGVLAFVVIHLMADYGLRLVLWGIFGPALLAALREYQREIEILRAAHAEIEPAGMEEPLTTSEESPNVSEEPTNR
jgi:hypothetical protein